jgi:hypothetical protein
VTQQTKTWLSKLVSHASLTSESGPKGKCAEVGDDGGCLGGFQTWPSVEAKPTYPCPGAGVRSAVPDVSAPLEPFFMSWTQTDASQAIDPKDLNGGILVADYEHDLGARITVEDLGDAAHYAITCGIYGWFFHTRFLTTSRADANAACSEMQIALDGIINAIPLKDDPERDTKCEAVTDLISGFVDNFS